MSVTVERVAIVGAGAMGSLFAARLALDGAEVTVIDVDDTRLTAMARDGITLVDDAAAQVARVGALRAEAFAGSVDLVIVFTKTMHTAAAVRSVAHLAGPDTLALTLQNGIGNAEILAEVFGDSRVLVGATDLPADLHPPARVSSLGKGAIWLGSMIANIAAVSAVADRFNRAGLITQVEPDILIRVWEKLAFNAALNAMATITGFTVGEMNTDAGRRLTAAVVGEVARVAHAQAIRVDAAAITAKIDHALATHGPHKASMLQDRLAGRPTEIEAINGAVVRAGAAAGVATPVTATLADLVRMVAG
jgi:2-dehydropantoate 2-reductase